MIDDMQITLTLLNPFGVDSNDLDVNYLLDRNIQVRSCSHMHLSFLLLLYAWDDM